EVAAEVAGGQADAAGVRHGDVAGQPRPAGAELAVGDGADGGELAGRVGAADAEVLGGEHAVAAGEVVARVVVQRAHQRELVRDVRLPREQLRDVHAGDAGADRLPQAAVLGRGLRLHAVEVE